MCNIHRYKNSIRTLYKRYTTATRRPYISVLNVYSFSRLLYILLYLYNTVTVIEYEFFMYELYIFLKKKYNILLLQYTVIMNIVRTNVLNLHNVLLFTHRLWWDSK